MGYGRTVRWCRGFLLQLLKKGLGCRIQLFKIIIISPLFVVHNRRPPMHRVGVSIVLTISLCMSSSLSLAVSSADKLPELPEGDPNSNATPIKLGEPIKLDVLGPIILNKDGSTRRIANWDEMTEAEKTATWRRISKRNEERRKKLLEAQQKTDEL